MTVASERRDEYTNNENVITVRSVEELKTLLDSLESETTIYLESQIEIETIADTDSQQFNFFDPNGIDLEVHPDG